MSIFYLKQNDTRPILEVTLTNPDGTAFDLTGTGVVVTLIVELNDGSVFSRAMTVYGTPTTGVVRYQWEATDWDTGNTAGYLVLGTAMGDSEVNSRRYKHQMEYEVQTNDGYVETFPNDGYDTLIITEELGSGA